MLVGHSQEIRLYDFDYEGQADILVSRSLMISEWTGPCCFYPQGNARLQDLITSEQTSYSLVGHGNELSGWL